MNSCTREQKTHQKQPGEKKRNWSNISQKIKNNEMTSRKRVEGIGNRTHFEIKNISFSGNKIMKLTSGRQRELEAELSSRRIIQELVGPRSLCCVGSGRWAVATSYALRVCWSRLYTNSGVTRSVGQYPVRIILVLRSFDAHCCSKIWSHFAQGRNGFPERSFLGVNERHWAKVTRLRSFMVARVLMSTCLLFLLPTAGGVAAVTVSATQGLHDFQNAPAVEVWILRRSFDAMDASHGKSENSSVRKNEDIIARGCCFVSWFWFGSELGTGVRGRRVWLDASRTDDQVGWYSFVVTGDEGRFVCFVLDVNEIWISFHGSTSVPTLDTPTVGSTYRANKWMWWCCGVRCCTSVLGPFVYFSMPLECTSTSASHAQRGSKWWTGIRSSSAGFSV